MATYRTAPHNNVPTDLIIYRLGHRLVYVKPAPTYEEALDLAQKEFFEELGDVDRSRIRFFIIATMQGGADQRIVRISEGAWASAVARLLRGEIIDVELRPDPNAPDAVTSTFLEVPSKEALDLARRRSLQGPPTQPAHSRRSSPTPSNSSRAKTKRRSWFGLLSH